MVDEERLRVLAQVAREISRPRSTPEILQTIVDAAKQSLPAIDEVGITVAHRDGRVETYAGTSELVAKLDELQYELGEGPCLHAMDPGNDNDVVRVDNLRHDQRWPQFIPQAARLGLRAQLGLRLYVDEHTIGGLNLYSTTSETIDQDTELLAELFASHAAVALGRTRREHQLEEAMRTRARIGQATGIMMERYRIDADRAFGHLVRLSQNENIKIRDLAEAIVRETVGAEGASRAERTDGGGPRD